MSFGSRALGKMSAATWDTKSGRNTAERTRDYWDPARATSSPLRWHPEYSQRSGLHHRQPSPMGGLEPIQEDVLGQQQFPSRGQHSARTTNYFNYNYRGSFNDRQDTRTPVNFNRKQYFEDGDAVSTTHFNSQNRNFSPNRGGGNVDGRGQHMRRTGFERDGNFPPTEERTSGLRGERDSWKNGGEHNESRSRTVLYDAYSESVSPSGFLPFPLADSVSSGPSETVAHDAPSSTRRGSRSDSEVRFSSQGSPVSKGGKSNTRDSARRLSNSSILKTEDASSSSYRGGVSNNNNNNNNKNNINSNNSLISSNNASNNPNQNDKNTNFASDSSRSKLEKKTYNILSKAQSNDDIVSSILATSNSGGIGKQTSTITFVGANGDPTTLDIPVVQTTSNRIKKLVSPIFMCLIVLALLGALAIAVYFALEFKASQEAQIEFLQATVKFIIAQESQSRDYSQLTSSERQALEAAYCKQVDSLYSRSSFGQDYRGCEVETLTNERIQFKLFFVDTPTNNKREDSIIEILAREGTTAGRQGERILQISDISVDISETSRSVELETTVKSEDFYGADSARRQDVGDKLQETAQAVLVTRTPNGSASGRTEGAADRPTSTESPLDQTVLNPEICASIHPDTIVAHPYGCSHYIQCVFDKPTTRPCDGGLVFDPEAKACALPRDDLPCKEITPCDNLNGGHFAHPTNCRLFVICDQGESVVRSCRQMVWDDVAKTCMPRARGTECGLA